MLGTSDNLMGRDAYGKHRWLKIHCLLVIRDRLMGHDPCGRHGWLRANH